MVSEAEEIEVAVTACKLVDPVAVNALTPVLPSVVLVACNACKVVPELTVNVPDTISLPVRVVVTLLGL